LAPVRWSTHVCESDLPFVLMNFSFNALDHALVIHTLFPHPFIALSSFGHQTGMVFLLGPKFFPIVKESKTDKFAHLHIPSILT